MSPQQPTPGDLIRYQATTSRWHLGIVRQVNSGFAEVEFFCGRTEDAPLEQITPFHAYLDARQNVLSLKRTDLCMAFFNNPLHRLREERLRIIQRTLRRHGLAFHPKEWPTPATRIQIWRDDSVVLPDGAEKSAKLKSLLPRWLEPLKLPPASRDPLGLQAPAERLANELLPGLTVFTSRVGYYGFLAWAVQYVNGSQCRGGQTRQERLHRLERALVLCEFVHHGARDDSCRVLGQRSKTQVLQSAEGERFRVPERILKNQASAGAYRLYFTSLQSLGFAREAPELGSEDLLPLALTDLGDGLARAFGKRVGDKLPGFALGDGILERDTILSYGKRLCFSQLGRLDRYREPFMDGFLLGNSTDAEKRHRTVRRLFARGLLIGDYGGQEEEPSGPEAVAEEEARVVEEPLTVAGLGNDRILLHFYEELPQADNRDFQVAAVFELLALGLSALFQGIVEALRETNRVRPLDLAGRLAGVGTLGGVWTSPFAARAAGVPPARALVKGLFEAETTMERAAHGGALLARVMADPAWRATAEDLAANPALLLTEVLRSKPERCLAEAFPDLAGAMVERHQVVSQNKNRQRWCYMEGDVVVKDELQEMQVGWHSFRFPQLSSLCRDLGLKAEDLGDVD